MSIYEANAQFYDSVWKHGRLRSPRRSSTWPFIASTLESSDRLLEIGPGLRPRLPLDDALFVDVSRVAVERLRRRGARAMLGSIAALPFEAERFDLVCALDVVEHADCPRGAVGELARMLTEGGTVVASVPLFAANWTRFDEIVGHRLRFEPAELAAVLDANRLEVVHSAAFGIQPRSRCLMAIGAVGLKYCRWAAAWFEDRIFLPLSRLFRKPIVWHEGFQIPPRADGLIVVCRKQPPQ